MNIRPFTLLRKVQSVPLAVWLLLLLTLPLGAGTLGIWLLNQMDAEECQAAQSSGAVSDSTRLYCAQSIASRGGSNDLAEAIRLADSIAFDHPLRTDGDRLVERWSSRLLELGETTFQQGNLNEAIALVEQIPVGTAIYNSVKPQVQKWQAIWQEAEAIHAQVETAIQEGKPTVALAEARKLLKVRNEYWSTNRFQELATQIQAIREDKKAASKNQKRVYETLSAQADLTTDTDSLLSNWQKEQAIEAARQLAKAKQVAAAGGISNLREAIAAAEMVFSGTPQYPQAQQLINEWNRQVESVEDRPFLDRATKLASKGDMNSLQSAISEANNVYFGRALYREAQSKIDDWTSQLRQIHDQQYSHTPSTTPSNQFRETDYRVPAATSGSP